MRLTKKRTQRVVRKNESMRMRGFFTPKHKPEPSSGMNNDTVAGLSLDFDNCAEILLSLVEKEEEDDVFRANCKLYDIPEFSDKHVSMILDHNYQSAKITYDKDRQINLEDEIQKFLSEVQPSQRGKDAFRASEKKKAKLLVNGIATFINEIPAEQKPKMIFLFIGSNRQNEYVDKQNADKHTLLIQYLKNMTLAKKISKQSSDDENNIGPYEYFFQEFMETPRDLRRSILMYPLLDKIADVLNKQLGEECNVTFQFEKGSLGDLETPIVDKSGFLKSLKQFDWEKYGKGFKNQNITPEAAENQKKFLNMYNVSRLLNLKRESQKELHFNFIDDIKEYVDEFNAMANNKGLITEIKSTSKQTNVKNVNLHLSGTLFDAYSNM